MATISTINGVDIGSVAAIDGVGIANIASVNGGEVVTADFIATIDSTYVDSELTDFPIGIKLNAVDGFAGYGTTDWQYLHATVGGSECYVEVDIWDTTNNIAVLWVKVPIVSSSADTMIDLNITAVKNDFITYSSATVLDDFTGTNGDDANPDLWKRPYTLASTTNFGAIINDNALKVYLTGVNGSGDDNCLVDSKFRLSGDFDIQIDFKNLVHLNHTAAGLEFGLWMDSGYHAFIKPGYNGGEKFSRRFYTTSANDANYDRTNDYGKLRITRTDSTFYAYTIDGDSETWVSRGSAIISTDDCYVQLRYYDYNSGSEVSCEVDNLTINSCDSITGYIGETGDTAAQTVWDSNAVGIYHLSQDPSGGAGSILDSTANGNVGTPDGAMASNDLVDGGFGKAITFDGSNDQIGLASVNYPSGSSNRTMTIMVSCSGTAIPWGYGIDIDDQRVLMVITANYTGIDIWGANIYYTNSGLTDGEYHVITAVLDGTTLNDIDIYVDGTLQTTVYSSTDPTSVFNTTLSLNYMGRNLSGTYYASNISELFVEDTNRSAAWIKATAQNLLGNLVAIS